MTYLVYFIAAAILFINYMVGDLTCPIKSSGKIEQFDNIQIQPPNWYLPEKYDVNKWVFKNPYITEYIKEKHNIRYIENRYTNEENCTYLTNVYRYWTQ